MRVPVMAWGPFFFDHRTGSGRRRLPDHHIGANAAPKGSQAGQAHPAKAKPAPAGSALPWLISFPRGAHCQ